MRKWGHGDWGNEGAGSGDNGGVGGGTNRVGLR